MRKLLLLLFFAIIHLYSFSQTDIQRDNRVNPVLKSALNPKSGYIIYGRANSSMFINIALLNQSSHTMSWFTCHGRLFDSTRLSDPEYGQVTSKKLDPFTLYQHICNEYLNDIAVVKDVFRLNGDNKLIDSLNPNYHALFASEIAQKAKTPLQKLIAIDNVRKHILTQLAYLNCTNPFGLQDNPLFKTNKGQAGTMVQTKDSTVYYNIDPTSAVTKISLIKNSPEKLYIYNRLSLLIDSVPVLPEKYNLLLKEKTDVFLLYRGWLELQWQNTMSNIMRYTNGIDKNTAGLYSQANLKDENSIEKELYNQLNTIEAKINVLISPEAKSIEQAIFDTYKNETSEINYIPLLGIGYDLVQKRGMKEYELTNHLGNVLVTLTDKKLGHSSNDSTVDYYNADIVSAQDYYPFGMLQPGRELNVEKYRYGFNGKENDNEVKGDGNQQDYGMRIYDPRVGRFLSVDPITRQYPQLTPYQFASNTPIQAIDLDGEEAGFIVNWLADKAKAMGSPRISGIIRSFGGSDPLYNAKQLGNKILHGDFKGAAAQVAGYMPAVMLYNLGKTGVEAAKGNKEAQGNLIGVSGQLLLGHVLTGGGVVEDPLVETNKTVARANNGNTGAVTPTGDPMIDEMSRPLTEPLPSSRTTVGLGVDADLASHRGTGAITYKNAGWQQAGLTKVDWGKMFAGDEFAIKEAFRDAVNKADAVRFDVTEFDPFYKKPGITNYEFNYITNDPALLKKTTFIQKGGEVKWDGKQFIKK